MRRRGFNSLPSRRYMRVLHTIKDRYGAGCWSNYGFVDAFNPLTNWYDTDIVGIDTGISVVMVENARTGFVWNTFMKNPEAQRGMERAGLKPYQPGERTKTFIGARMQRDFAWSNLNQCNTLRGKS